MVWYSHLFKNVLVCGVLSFNTAEIMIFLHFDNLAMESQCEPFFTHPKLVLICALRMTRKQCFHTFSASQRTINGTVCRAHSGSGFSGLPKVCPANSPGSGPESSRDFGKVCEYCAPSSGVAQSRPRLKRRSSSSSSSSSSSGQNHYFSSSFNP